MASTEDAYLPAMENPSSTNTPNKNNCPAQRVLGTYELLESILYNMPKPRSPSTMRTLLRAQRVNTKFRDIIARSYKLQEMLFCRPISAGDALAAQEETKKGVRKKGWKRQDLVHKTLNDWNPLLRIMQLEKGKDRQRHHHVRKRPDPVTFFAGDYIEVDNVCFRVPFLNIQRPGESTDHQSWHRMLLAQNEVSADYVSANLGGENLGGQIGIDLGDTVDDIIRNLRDYEEWDQRDNPDYEYDDDEYDDDDGDHDGDGSGDYEESLWRHLPTWSRAKKIKVYVGFGPGSLSLSFHPGGVDHEWLR